jgi:two-component system chemotaxis response regulator CheY
MTRRFISRGILAETFVIVTGSCQHEIFAQTETGDETGNSCRDERKKQPYRLDSRPAKHHFFPTLFVHRPEKHVVHSVLVVDDSRVMREMIIACLRGLDGLTFSQAATGLEAIERLSLEGFSLVVLDLNMPDVGGMEVLDFVRSQDRLKSLPVLIVTTRGDETSRARALEAGASRFMTKPFAPEELMSQVKSLLPAPA